MNWLALFFALELGWMPAGDFIMYTVPPEIYSVRCSAYTELYVEAELFGIGFIGGGIRTSIWYNGEGYTFWPNRATYEFRAGARWGPLEIGWRHFCMHPVIPMFEYVHPDAIWEGAYEELYLRVSSGR